MKKRMAEALRESQYPQTRGGVTARSDNGEVIGLCALGQIYEGVFGELPLRILSTTTQALLTVDVRAALENAGYPMFQVAKHPVTGEEHTIGWIIESLNDSWDYSSSEIATWLEKEEERIAQNG